MHSIHIVRAGRDAAASAGPDHPAGTPRYIRMHANDNVAIVVNDGGLQAGAVFDDGLVLLGPVPQGHKVALRDLGQGDAVTRYNVTIGYAAGDIAAGSWVSEANLRMPDALELGGLPIANRPAPAMEPLEG